MWYFDPSTDEWSLEPLLLGSPGPRSGSAMAYDAQSDRLVLFGGIGPWDGNDPRFRGALLGDTWVFDPSAREWTEISPQGVVPDARAFHAMVYEPGTDQILMWGGRLEDDSPGDPTMWSFDVESSQWSPVDVAANTTTPHPRRMHAMVYEPQSGLIFMFGGEWIDANGRTFGDDVWLFDPQDKVWQQQADIGGPAGRPQAAATGQGTVLAFVGMTGVYSPASDQWRSWTQNNT